MNYLFDPYLSSGTFLSLGLLHQSRYLIVQIDLMFEPVLGICFGTLPNDPFRGIVLSRLDQLEPYNH